MTAPATVTAALFAAFGVLPEIALRTLAGLRVVFAPPTFYGDKGSIALRFEAPADLPPLPADRAWLTGHEEHTLSVRLGLEYGTDAAAMFRALYGAVVRGLYANALRGRVVETYSETVRVMSDVWENYSYADAFVTFEDGRSGVAKVCVEHVEVSGGRFTVDAPAELRGAAADYARLCDERHVAARAHEDETRPAEPVLRDALVVLSRGTKHPTGGMYVVSWVGEGQSYAGRSSTRVGLRTVNPETGATSDEVIYTDARNVDVIVANVRGDDWRNPVAEAFRGLGAYLSDAFTLAGRDPAPCRDLHDAHGLLWSCPACAAAEGTASIYCNGVAARRRTETLALARRMAADPRFAAVVRELVSAPFYRTPALRETFDAGAVCDAFDTALEDRFVDLFAEWTSAPEGPAREDLRRAWREEIRVSFPTGAHDAASVKADKAAAKVSARAEKAARAAEAKVAARAARKTPHAAA